MTACTQPGCTGEIEDGYCNVCGSPGPAEAPAAAATGAAAPPAGSVRTAPVAAGSSPSPPRPSTMTPRAGVPAARDADDPLGGAGSTRTRGTSSARLASTALGSARVNQGGSRTTRKLGTASTRLRGPRLGAGITTIPSVPLADPVAAVMAVAEVPENKRVCSRCGNPVGRSRDGREGRPEGFCPNCGTPFSFTPKLTPGTLVGGQYQVAGALAHGGLGWIYLARDKNVSDRWVVLKGLLNSDDPDALAAAIAERQFLAEVEHPLIVEIYNFTQHEGAGYIVMEYVGGLSLKQILRQRMRDNHGAYSPVPLDQALAYVVEILPAFQYLHDASLLYCDFKPDNLIQSGDSVKLIDLGGVWHLGNKDDAPIFGTVGYQAPEVPETGPTIPSDIWTIGRTLAVLAMEFGGYQTRFVASLPPVEDVPLFAANDSFYRLLLKACAPDPADRFQSADELRVQMLGVLRETVASARADLVAAGHSTRSPLFEAPAVVGDTLTWDQLPQLRVDDGDPAAAWLSTVTVTDPEQRIRELEKAPETTVEVRLELARAAIRAERYDVLDRVVSEILTEDSWEWRAVWMAGIGALARGDLVSAQSSFNAVYGQVPGELAPKLALAVACETGGRPEVAEGLYLTCARTDANYTATAALAVARIRTAWLREGQGELAGVLAALDLVPPTSRAFVAARSERAEALVEFGDGLDGLAQAMESVRSVAIDPRTRAALTTDVLAAALHRVGKSGPRPQMRIGGVVATEDGLRTGLEGAYRSLAALTTDHAERVRLVDRANAVRPWTLR